MTEIIYGSKLAAQFKAAIKQKTDRLQALGKREPCLAVIMVGNDPASLSYIRAKEKACREVGFLEQTFLLDERTSQAELEAVISECNTNEEIDGILVQLPLPPMLDEESALAVIDPRKDVDGLNPINIGRLYAKEPSFIPCTPAGIMAILKCMHCDLDGRHAVVLGRSRLVGTPVSRLLLNANATVTICHSHTPDPAALTLQADVLIAAVGKAKYVTADMVKEGAFIVDVGVNRLADGHLCGDVDFAQVKEKAAAITVVPGGVGPMTIAMLLQNTLQAYEERGGCSTANMV